MFQVRWGLDGFQQHFTIFTDVQLFEVNQAGDGGGQVGQVVIRHAQLLQGLAVEELLWEHTGTRQRNITVCWQIHTQRPLTERYKKHRKQGSPLEARAI